MRVRSEHKPYSVTLREGDCAEAPLKVFSLEVSGKWSFMLTCSFMINDGSIVNDIRLSDLQTDVEQQENLYNWMTMLTRLLRDEEPPKQNRGKRFERCTA